MSQAKQSHGVRVPRRTSYICRRPALALDQGLGHRRAEVHGPGRPPAPPSQALGLDPLQAQIRAGRLLRHAGPGAQPGRPRGAGAAASRAARRRLRRQAAPGRARPAVRELRRRPSFGVEVDALPGGFVCSALVQGRARTTRSGRGSAASGRSQAVHQGAARVLRRRTRPTGIALDDLATLGPIFVLKLEVRSADEASIRRLVAELWLYPDGSRILELSTKCAARARRSRSPPRRARSSPSAGSTSSASSRPRPRRRSSSTSARGAVGPDGRR